MATTADLLNIGGTGVIRGKVSDEEGRPIADARVFIYAGQSAGFRKVLTTLIEWKAKSGEGAGAPKNLYPITTNKDGVYTQEKLLPGPYHVWASAFGQNEPTNDPRKISALAESCTHLDLAAGEIQQADLKIPLGITCKVQDVEDQVKTAFQEGDTVVLRVSSRNMGPCSYTWDVPGRLEVVRDVQGPPGSVAYWTATGEGIVDLSVTITEVGSASIKITFPRIAVLPRPGQSIGTVPVTMRRTAVEPTSDQALWVVIRNSTNAIGFENYVKTIDRVMCCPGSLEEACTRETEDPIDPCALPPINQRRFLPFPDMDGYRVLKVATECFLMMKCGVYVTPVELSKLVQGSQYDITEDASRLNTSAAGLPQQIANWWSVYLSSGDEYLNAGDSVSVIPYLALVRSRLRDLTIVKDYQMGITCYGILKRKLTNPCFIELIWSYWHEEAMLVQTMNAISRRFQNLRNGERDPLARLDIDPLRPLNSLLWGYIQDEQHRLSVIRRAYEYNHEYGLTLEGKALRPLRPSDSRSKFLEGFHNLLYLCTTFFNQDDDATVVADGFPLLNALKEVHYVLAAGAHNQFGELPSTARQEMLMQQWLLARPEMREFLGGKIMVPYPEEWMDRVDNVKTMEGWTDVSVIHFHDLAAYGEQIVLSIRYGAWSITTNPAQAANWARYWRAEIQGYIHAYRAVTGVDLTAEPVSTSVGGAPTSLQTTLPSILLSKRLAAQKATRR